MKGLQWARVNFALATIFLERFDELQGIDTRQHWTTWPAEWVIELDDLHRAADPLVFPADLFDSMVLQNALYFLGIKIADAVWGEDTTIH